MAAKYPTDLFMMSKTGNISNEQEQEETPEKFRTVTYGKNVRRKKRKIREGSFGSQIENLTSKADSSSEAEPPSVFSTPKSKPPEMKLYARPIDKTKSLNNVNPNTIAKTITSCSGSPPDFIKPLRTPL